MVVVAGFVRRRLIICPSSRFEIDWTRIETLECIFRRPEQRRAITGSRTHHLEGVGEGK
jgi:hypothetical protein